MQAMQPLGLYVHIPFCLRKCFYCDFASGPVGEVKRSSHLGALEGEIRASAWRGSAVRTVFLGGGTPSELRVDELERLVDALASSFDLSRLSEWTIECNPGTLSPLSLRAYRELGINRISLGVQSFHDRHLKALGRVHDSRQAREAVAQVRQAGFDNLNLDLIFALPGQTLQEWRTDLDEAVSYSPEHLSLYNLTIETGTEFGRRKTLGLLREADDDLAADMYEGAIDACVLAGLEQYEISNFARPGRQCRHNMTYWRNEPYLGFGISAASYVDGVRWSNCRDLDDYEAGASEGRIPRESEERLTQLPAMGEEFMLRLRTAEGVSLGHLSQKHSCDSLAVFGAEIESLQADGLLYRVGDRIRLTRSGILLADAVCSRFLQTA